MIVTKLWNRMFNKPNWHNLRSTRPLSRVFGLDRGLPIDRFYIEQFLDKHRDVIKKKVLEVSEDTYVKQFGSSIESSDILHVDNSARRATVIGDLTKPTSLPENAFDCFICTQTLNFVYDVHNAVKGIHRLLKPGGTVLATAAGVCQISRYDMERWGDYWRFTSKSLQILFQEAFAKEHVVVTSYGNVLSAIAFLEGLAASELTSEELLENDPEYQVVICVRARKS